MIFAHQKLIETQRLLQRFKLASFDEQSVAVMRQLLKQHQSRKRYADVQLAALALTRGDVVVTRNTTHFVDLLPGNRLQNWIDDLPQ